jgi:hypothetical protein
MVRVSVYVLLFVLTFVVPTFQRQQGASGFVPSSSLEEDEAYLLALKYRQEVLQVIETSDFCRSAEIVPNSSSQVIVQFCETNLVPSPLSNSCDSFVSLQL